MAENQVKVRPALRELNVGETVTFPIARTKVVRAQASDLGLILERKYKTETDRGKRIIIPTDEMYFDELVKSFLNTSG